MNWKTIFATITGVAAATTVDAQAVADYNQNKITSGEGNRTEEKADQKKDEAWMAAAAKADLAVPEMVKKPMMAGEPPLEEQLEALQQRHEQVGTLFQKFNDFYQTEVRTQETMDEPEGAFLIDGFDRLIQRTFDFDISAMDMMYEEAQQALKSGDVEKAKSAMQQYKEAIDVTHTQSENTQNYVLEVLDDELTLMWQTRKENHNLLYEPVPQEQQQQQKPGIGY